MAKLDVELTVNGEKHKLKVGSQERLLDTIREQLKLTGTKEGCSVGECGACTVIVDDQAVNSCMVLTAQVDGSEIITVEGLESKSGLHPLQKAFIEKQAVQCGFCTPGMLMSALALLNTNPEPSKEEIKTALEGNLCRCTGYQQIIDAVEMAAEEWGA
ncbi:carbon-monoxide dehydrogenase small subunit [Halanaerobium saccharolyticum]|jgi:carbon-monoxide dehydrogenase small subunit|uniref:Carbon-monoxide dehydrogenase small subunit n=1 Tax=Halanaerobium saccharolyticum TaxID=43595 RepID=A0A2T5RQF1_9FIRM|nr:(2Fe-2S)-binding protein [Halanaerobium saccharolyticum]PTW02215.1 carbon-monoxide dehydrogenase small subunit [Halanaerobium saccharolyticum]PUU95613.1 MAG: carbon-monoxide dehydrogenase small subunit [Halanaerobium sp.]